MNKKVKNLIYGIQRSILKKILTNNLGRVVEEDEKLICYVKKREVKSKYNIRFYGISYNLVALAKEFKLDKPICYVLDGIDFSKKIKIFCFDNCEIIIKNCKFDFGPWIVIVGNCTLENIIAEDCNSAWISVKELIIKNMNLDNLLSVGIDADSIKIIDSNIGQKYNEMKVKLSTDDLEIINSKISGNDIECKSKKINIDENSTLTASNKVEIETEDFNSINVSSPVIILNDEEVHKEKEQVTLKKATDPLVSKRMELLNILKIIKNNCESVNSQMALQYQEELNNQPINKALRKIDK